MKNVLQKAANQRKYNICGMEMPLNPPFPIHKTLGLVENHRQGS